MPDTFAVLVAGTLDTDLTGALMDATVMRGLELPTTFTLRFSVDRCGGGYQLIDDEDLQPWSRKPLTLLAAAGVRGTPPTWDCLVVGYLVEKKVIYGEGGANAVLEVRGEDRSLLLDTNPESPIEGSTLPDVLTAIFEPVEGVRPEIDAPALTRTDTENPHLCHENMRTYVTDWADNTGCRCWIENAVSGSDPSTLTVSETVHFSRVPPRALGAPVTLSAPPEQKVLRIGGQGCETVRTLEVTVNGNVPTRSSLVQALRRETGQVVDATVDGASVEPLGDEGADSEAAPTGSLGARGGVTPEEQRVMNQAAVDDAQWFVEARTEITAEEYGAILRPGQQIAVRGSGARNSVSYLVRAVQHHVDASRHAMELTLISNAQGSVSAGAGLSEAVGQ
jgi:hypothetical protein